MRSQRSVIDPAGRGVVTSSAAAASNVAELSDSRTSLWSAHASDRIGTEVSRIRAQVTARDTPRQEEGRSSAELVSLTLPPIDRLPTDDAGPGAEVFDSGGRPAFDSFLAGMVRWNAVRVALSGRVTAALWILVIGDVVVGSWLFAVVLGPVGCDGSLCSTATLGGHPAVTFGLAAVSAVTLLAVVVPTRGLTEGGGLELVVISVAAVLAIVSIIGAVLVVAFLMLLAAIVLTVLVAVLLAVTGNDTHR